MQTANQTIIADKCINHIIERGGYVKKVLSVILIAVMLFALSGCNSGGYDNVPEIMLVLETKYYDGYALTKQNITILNNDGGYLNYVGSDQIDFSEDGLYDRLWNEMIFSTNTGREPLSKKELRKIRRNVQNFEKWSEQAPVECGNIYDYDRSHNLYGIYYDSNGVPQITWLAKVGQTIECRGDPEAAGFANSTGLLPFTITL